MDDEKYRYFKSAAFGGFILDKDGDVSAVSVGDAFYAGYDAGFALGESVGRGETQLAWTSEPPKAPGLYIRMRNDLAMPHDEYIRAEEIGQEWVASWWFGPVPDWQDLGQAPEPEETTS
jgi:hypothetical protein